MVRAIATVILVAAVGATVALAQGAPQYWVTYAYDGATGAWGLGWGRTDRQATINDALSRCAKPGCKAGNVTVARCIAASKGTQPGVWFGAGNEASTAKEAALGFCRKGGAGSTCEVLAVRCAD